MGAWLFKIKTNSLLSSRSTDWINVLIDRLALSLMLTLTNLTCLLRRWTPGFGSFLPLGTVMVLDPQSCWMLSNSQFVSCQEKNPVHCQWRTEDSHLSTILQSDSLKMWNTLPGVNFIHYYDPWETRQKLDLWFSGMRNTGLHVCQVLLMYLHG